MKFSPEKLLLILVIALIALYVYRKISRPGPVTSVEKNMVSSRCNCSVTINTPNGQITQKGVLTSSGCDTSAC